MPAPWNRFATLLPAITSDEPCRGILPSMSRTCGRSAREASPMPRITTLDGAFVPRFTRLISTTSSFARSCFPSPPTAISGWVATTAAWSRSTPLCTSDWEALRMTMMLSKEPVSMRVFRRPAASISVAANTKTTSAMPDAVSTVVSLRVRRLRRL